MSSGIEKNWISIQKNDFDDSNIKKYSSNKILTQLLANRGITSREQVFSYLYPSFKDLNDPCLLPGIQDAVSRIKCSIEENENIIIFGDYDTDGIISTAMMYNFLKKVKSSINVDYYIPDRFEEGYDINVDFIWKISSVKKYSLVICVDCGTNASEVIDFIESDVNNPDIVVCDHHEPSGGSLEEFKKYSKYIIVNPKLPGSSYPYKFLSAAGVTFKVIHAILKNLDDERKKSFSRQYLNEIIDMAAVSTVADLMPLTGENRVIVKAGLKIIKNSKNPGLLKMVNKIIQEKSKISAYDIGFIIAPRLNAAGRIEHAEKGLDLLIDKQAKYTLQTLSSNRFDKILDELGELNIKRQKIQKNILSEILENAEHKNKIKKYRVLIAKSEKWNEGVIGVVAADIVKKYNVPVILFKQNGNNLKGSGRSNGSFDLYSSLCQLKKYFTKFGGHSQACGITMDLSDFKRFAEEMQLLVLNKLSPDDIKKTYYYDMELSFEDIDFSLLKELEKLEPYGIGNIKPVFFSRKCTIVNEPDFLKNNSHAAFRLSNNNKSHKCIFFNFSDTGCKKEEIIKGMDFDIIYNINKSESMTEETFKIQLNILDARLLK